MYTVSETSIFVGLILVILLLAAAGTRPIRTILRTSLSDQWWARRRLYPMFPLLFFIFAVPFTILYISFPYTKFTWDKFVMGYVLGMLPGTLVILVFSIAFAFGSTYMIHRPDHGVPWIAGIVATTPRVVGPVGTANRPIRFEVVAEDETRWTVTSDTRLHAPLYSLAMGRIVRHVPPTMEDGAVFPSLSEGTRVLVRGARAQPTDPRDISVQQPDGLLVPGGFAAARTWLIFILIGAAFMVIKSEGLLDVGLSLVRSLR